MKFIHFIFIVYLLFFEDVLSQRIISRPELLLENQQQQQQQQQPVPPRGRGRARFSVTPEFEQVQADYEKTARQESPQRTRVATPSKRVITNRRNYEVEEVLDDVPDSARKYSSRPRVVTEMRYEAVNAPRDSTLFIPSSEAAIEPKKDELLKSSAPSASTIEATNHASSTENSISSSSEDGSKSSDQTTEQEIMSKELMKSSTPEIRPESLKPQRKRPAPTVDIPAPTKIRTRGRKGPPRYGESDSVKASTTTSASSIRKEDYLRKQELNRITKPAVVPETFTKRTEPEPQPQTVQQIVQQSVGRNNFRSGRRRSGSVESIQPEKESSASTDFRRPRGPSVFQDGQDLQPSRTRTGRRAVNASRRFPSRTTANGDETASTTEQQVSRGRSDGRRGRNFTRDSQQAQRLEEPTKETSTFSSRRRVPVKPTTSNNPAPIRSRTTFDFVKSETTTRINIVQANRTINRSRSRFNPTNIDEQKLEVLPLFEREPKTVQTNRQQSYNRRRGGKETTSNEFDQKKGRPRVVVVRKETVTEAAKPPTFKPTVKESVHSEVSEVISTRKVTRPKPRGTKKATVTTAQKKSSGEEEIDESDNYPESFKALLHKQHKQNDSKDANHKSSRTRATEDGTSSAADGTTVPASSSTHLAFTPDALAISSSATPSIEVSPSSASSSLLVDSSTISSSRPALSPDENEILAANVVKPTPIVRPTRRRFSLATKPSQDPTTKKSFVPSRKATVPRPYKKYTTDATLSVSVHSSTQRYHARFTGPADALSADNGDVHVQQQPTSSVNLDRPTTFRRNFPTKGGTLPVKVVQDRPERKQIPIKGNKIVEQQSNKTSAPLKRHGHVAPSAASRYSSRYRGGDLGARLHGAHNTHSRGTTVVPVYVPTVPSITPSTTVSFLSSSGVHTEENDLGLQVISIDEPANSLYSDNLVVMGDNSTTPSSVPKEDNDQNKKSILERIIYSLTALSTTTTTAPPNNDLTNKRLLKKQTANADSNSSAIYKIASKKTKQSTASNQLIKPAQSNDWQMTSLTDDSSERPTTVIERIIDSLSAIQAIDSSTIDPIQVGTSANNLFNAPTKSMSFKRMSTIAPQPIQPPPQPTIIPARSVGDFTSSSPISGDTINMFLKLLNLDTARSTSTTTQPKLFNLSISTHNPIDQSKITNGNNFQNKTFSSSFPSNTFASSTPEKISSFAYMTPQELSTFSPTIFNSYGTTQPTTASRPPLIDQFTTPPYKFNTERIEPTTFKSPSSLFTTNRPTTTISSNNIVTNSITQPPIVTTTHNILNDVELLFTAEPNRGSDRFQSTTLVPQSQTTIAISLADFLASLNKSPSTMSTNIPMLVPVTSTLPTVIDTIDSSTAFRDVTSTLVGNLVTETRPTTIPTTATDGQELKNRGLLENFTVSPESVEIVSANDLSQTTFSPDVLSILPLFSDITITTTTTPQEVDTSTQVTTTDINTITNSITTDSNELTTVSLASTTDLDNNIVTSTDRPAMSQSQNMSQTSRLIADFMRDNAIKPPTSDYYVFAVLPNNTIVRKRPRAYVPQDSPYIIVGVYPNNTVVHKYPNGSLVPEESVIQDNIVQNVASPSVEAILRSLDSSSSSSSIIQFTTSNPTTITERNENSIVQLNEILSGRIIEEFNNIMNKTTETSKDAKEIDVLVTTGPNTEEFDIDNNVISTRARPEKVIISTTRSPFTITDGISTNTFKPITSNQPTTTKFETTTLVPTTSEIITNNPTTTARTTTTTDIPTTIFKTSTLNPTTQFRTTRINPTTENKTPANRFSNGRTTLPPFLANLLSTAIVQETNPPNVPIIFGISRTTSNRPTTTTEPYRGIATTVTGPPPEIFEIQTTDWPISSTPVPRINVVPVIPARPLVNTPLDVQSILRLLEEYTGSTITPRTVSRTTRRTTTDIYTTTDLENEIDSSSRFVELHTPNSGRRFRTTTVSTTIPTTTTTTTTEVPTTLLRTTTLTPTTATAPPTTFIPTTQEPITRRTPSRIKSTEVPTTTQRYFNPTINPDNIDTKTLIARAKNRSLTEQQKQDLVTLEALENEQKALLEQLSLLTNLNVKQNKPTNKPPASGNSNSLANRIINFASERDRRTTTEKLPELTLGEKSAVTTRNQQPKIAVINGKAIPVDELLKKINDNGINSVSSTYGSSNDAILAAILKEQGIGPTTPQVLSNIYEDITTTRRTTPRTIRTTTRPVPGPIMQGLSWILNAIGPQNPPSSNSPPRRFRTNPSTTNRPPTTVHAFEELQTQTSLRTTQTTRAPTTTIQFKRPANSLSDDELQRLISQLEAIQQDPRKAKELDLSNLKKLTTAPTTQSQRLRDNVQLVHSGEQGTIPSLYDDSDNVYIRGRKAKSTTAPSVASVSNSITAEDFDVDDDVVVVTKAPARTPAQAPQRPRQTLGSVQLNPIRGIDHGAEGQQGDGQVRGSLITAAVNVTRAISTFLGSAIQAAAQQLADMIATPSARGQGLSSSS